MKTYIVAVTEFECQGGGQETTLTMLTVSSLDQLIRDLTDYDGIKADFEADGETFEATLAQVLKDQEELTTYTVAELIDGKLVPINIYSA